MRERDAIYADAEADETEFLRAADLEAKYTEYGGYTANARAAELLLGMPNVMLLDEPTNHLDMESIESLNTALDRKRWCGVGCGLTNPARASPAPGAAG